MTSGNADEGAKVDTTAVLRGTSPAGDWLIRAPKGFVPGVGFVSDCEVLVRGSQIAWVGHRDSRDPRPAFDGAAVAEFAHATLMPGLVDSHIHLSFSGANGVVATLADESDLVQLARSVGNAQTALRHGITTQVDCGSRGLGVYALRDAIAAGLLTGPRILASGAPITTTAGHCHWLGGRADSHDDAVLAVRARVAEGADVVKVMLTGGNMTRGSNPSSLQFPPETVTAMGREAARLGKPLVAHAHCEEAVALAALSGATVIAHATCARAAGELPQQQTLEAVLQSGAYVDPTLMVGQGIDGEGLEPEARAQQTARARVREAMIPVFQAMSALGIPLLAGTDGGSTGVAHHLVAASVQSLHTEIGLSVEDALLAATDLPARAYSIRHQTGALEAGLRADLLVVAGDVERELSALDRPLAVWTGGARVVGPAAETLSEEEDLALLHGAART